MPGKASLLAAVHAREEAIRQARRMGDPAAVCAALAVMGAWEADEARGRDLAGRFVEGGLLTGEQLRTLIGVDIANSSGGASQPPASARAAELALQHEPAAVGLLEAPEPAPPPPLPVDTTMSVVSPPTATEIGAAEAPSAMAETTPFRPSRRPLVVAAFLGVAVALTFWLRFGMERSQTPPAPEPPAPSLAPFPSVPPPPAPAPKLAAFPSAPLPPPPAPARPPAWAPRLREVREGDSSSINDRLGRLAKQVLVDVEPAGVSFDAQQLVARRPRKDRIVTWVELKLGRFHAVAGLQSRLEDGAEAVDIAWSRE